ncbi:MAG: TetM/TetW/TetO/TetS family tetracycline resistance ribosomal protection protein, partial [Eubacteriales bacterium]|nr:TetM/TetW/TetO/TetS family tetracycline resistance ribosomal protection protein [Eubacteriales bacterium]
GSRHTGLAALPHRNIHLDTWQLEKARGITIFSKQALFELGDMDVTLLDTPGHVDFSAEMERTLQVLDYAVLVISGADGVQGHVLTLWKLLKRYEIPVFLFINKMDQEGTDRESLMEELVSSLDEHCVAFGGYSQEWMENVAVCDEKTLEEYLEKGSVCQEEIKRLIRERKLYPCYFGSALKDMGVADFLKGMEEYISCPVYPKDFGALVYKISRDAQGIRLTHLKITGGTLKVKIPVCTDAAVGTEEKPDQIRLYSGAGFQVVQEAEAGSICAVTGLSSTRAGDRLGGQADVLQPALEPVLMYRILLPEGCDAHTMLLKMRQMEEEDPMLQVSWDEAAGEIHAKVMGNVQIEILKSLILERFGIEVEFGQGTIVYKETIEKTVEGVGHFEPLRHYAEVHLLLEPLKRGSGLVFESDCSEDVLDKNWQRLILTNLQEKNHRGVLTGAEITDMKITVIAGKAHLKHTEGGDFRQATYRAVRQGLRSTKNVLLEPVYEFRLEVPQECVGRAMADISRMNGNFEGPDTEGDMAVLTGSAPVSEMRDYQMEVVSYTRGRGRITYSLKGYEVCHNAEEIISAAGYDPDADLENPAGSVFCAHGAGFQVPWDKVKEYMHVESAYKEEPKELPAENAAAARKAAEDSLRAGRAMDKELEEIFNRTYRAGKEERSGWGRNRFRSGTERGDGGSKVQRNIKQRQSGEEYLLVDGYNIIFAWEDLRELAKVDISAARGKLMDALCNYQGFKQNTLILVFDAYKVPGGTGSVEKYHNIYVVYTKEAETADQYIEKTVHTIGKQYHVTVATSDALEQMIIWGEGAARMSASGLLDEIRVVGEQIRGQYLDKAPRVGQKVLTKLPDDYKK